jgi:3,4-dihydroxy 2-butanone 4-phosphate synthase/GTP cyclohydrolase II
MVNKNTSNFGTAFTVSVDAKHGVTTGISAHDRAKTIKAFIDPTTKPEDMARPGHIFPLLAKDGGVLMRTGHTEAIVDLAKLSGLYPAGVICEIMNDDGSMAKLPQLEETAKKYGIKIVSIADLVRYRYYHEKLVHRVVETKLPTKYGDFTAIAYNSEVYAGEHVALVMGDIWSQEPALVRVHTECITGDAFDSLRCDCGAQLTRAMEKIADERRGALLYMRPNRNNSDPDNRSFSCDLPNKESNVSEICDPFKDTSILCNYDIAAQILLDLGVNKVRLITNNRKRAAHLERCGVKVDEITPINTSDNTHNKTGLKTAACS